ncbi:MAG TPA: YoaK family protein [Polyangiaceae bacterium]|nr:YoaK family protein [Polyangiaceae bacterium]
MFSREGSARSDSQNRWLAGYLAFVGGFVNSSGFVLIGTFSSHVTGNVGRLANDAATGQYAAALAALSLVLCFFAGAFAASVILESRFLGGPSSRAYALALATETLLLLIFALLSYVTTSASAHPRVRDAETALLCAAMGLQNALVSRLSGAVVRTTHLTGVVTDLGIEGARWFRFWRRSLSEVMQVPLVLGRNRAERPAAQKILLLATIAASFLAGASTGAYLAVHWHQASMLIAAAAVGAGAVHALRN